MLASEGILLSVFGVVYGLMLGGILSLVLVFVVNRQSFNWSIDLAVPLVAAWPCSASRWSRPRRHGNLERPRGDEPRRGARRAGGLVSRASARRGSARAVRAAVPVGIAAAAPRPRRRLTPPVDAGRPIDFPRTTAAIRNFAPNGGTSRAGSATDRGDRSAFKSRSFARARDRRGESERLHAAPADHRACAISDPKRGRLWQDQRIRARAWAWPTPRSGDTDVWIDRWS
jgi:hypothetical protein